MSYPSDKAELRRSLRTARKEHVLAQPDMVRALLFSRPPAPLHKSIPEGAVIGLYHATEFEAPTRGYGQVFYEAGHRIALPRFADESDAMHFAEHSDPFDQSDLEQGPFNLQQPGAQAAELVPDIVFVPLIGFTPSGARLGQGGGHYDRWLAEHKPQLAIGLAWDVQCVEPESALPIEPHDMPLDAVVTPARIYGLN